MPVPRAAHCSVRLDATSLEQGMVTTAGVVSHTGVGGYTLGGGFGRLNRKYGLTVDNVRGAEIVTADGEVRRISADQEPDLFWAIRGGGGNFGVVTEFEYQLYPFDRNVLSGSIVWPMENARDVLEYYAEAAAGLLGRDVYRPGHGEESGSRRRDRHGRRLQRRSIGRREGTGGAAGGGARLWWMA